MGIEKINLNSVENKQGVENITHPVSQQKISLAPVHDSVSFTGTASKAGEAVNLLKYDRVLSNSLKPYHQKWINWMKSLEWLKGESGNIIITAIGTGIVAPMFIGLNPFVKAPKDATEEQKKEVRDTKWYTAIRQPISAVLALVFQASILKYIDKGLDSIFNNPNYSKKVWIKTDHSALNTDTYVKELVKKEMKREGETKPSLLRAIFSPDARIKRGIYYEHFDQRVKALQKEQLDKLAKSFAEKNIIKVGERQLDNKMMGEIINAQIDSYINTARKLLKDDQRIVDCVDKADLLVKNEQYFKDLANKLPLKEIEQVQIKELVTQVLPIEDIKKAKDPEFAKKLKNEAGETLDILIGRFDGKNKEITDLLKKLKAETLKDTPQDLIKSCKEVVDGVKEDKTKLYKQLTDTVKDLYEKETVKGLKEELKSILDKSEDLRGNRVSRILERIKNIKKSCEGKEGGYTRENYRAVMNEKMSKITDRIQRLMDCKIGKDELEKTDSKAVKQVVEKIYEALKLDKKDPIASIVLADTDMFGSVKSKIYKDLTKTYKSIIKNAFKNFNQVSKMIIGAVITIPITCTALNWVYPRFMEIVFPGLAGVKKAKAEAASNGGDK